MSQAYVAEAVGYDTIQLSPATDSAAFVRCYLVLTGFRVGLTFRNARTRKYDIQHHKSI
jgi:hypothetical protein